MALILLPLPSLAVIFLPDSLFPFPSTGNRVATSATDAFLALGEIPAFFSAEAFRLTNWHDDGF